MRVYAARGCARRLRRWPRPTGQCLGVCRCVTRVIRTTWLGLIVTAEPTTLQLKYHNLHWAGLGQRRQRPGASPTKLPARRLRCAASRRRSGAVGSGRRRGAASRCLGGPRSPDTPLRFWPRSSSSRRRAHAASADQPVRRRASHRKQRLRYITPRGKALRTLSSDRSLSQPPQSPPLAAASPAKPPFPREPLVRSGLILSFSHSTLGRRSLHCKLSPPTSAGPNREGASAHGGGTRVHLRPAFGVRLSRRALVRVRPRCGRMGCGSGELSRRPMETRSASSRHDCARWVRPQRGSLFDQRVAAPLLLRVDTRRRSFYSARLPPWSLPTASSNVIIAAAADRVARIRNLLTDGPIEVDICTSVPLSIARVFCATGARADRARRRGSGAGHV